MFQRALQRAIAMVRPGPWAVGVSGGADSVALLLLLLDRPEVSLHVVHLDHQTRGQASAADAHFVEQLSRRLGVACTMVRRDQIEPEHPDLPANLSARFRALRMNLFAQVVARHRLQGVLLGHHADDQAETIFHRLLRGSGPAGLGGMRPQSRIGGLLVRRPLLPVRRDHLRQYLRGRGQEWREDASNVTDEYARNRLRKVLADHPSLHDALLELGEACTKIRDWLHGHSPRLGAKFGIEELAALPAIIAQEAARRWLIERGVPARQVEPAVIQRLIDMATDAASSPRRHFPGRLLVRRRAGTISAEDG